MSDRIGEVYRRQGPLNAFEIKQRLHDGWILQTFDYQIKWHDKPKLHYVETGKRVNVLDVFVYGDDPLAGRDITYLFRADVQKEAD